MLALLLDRLPALPDLRGDVLDLDNRVRLDDAQQVLLQERVVQRGEVRADRDVGGELCLGVGEGASVQVGARRRQFRSVRGKGKGERLGHRIAGGQRCGQHDWKPRL